MNRRTTTRNAPANFGIYAPKILSRSGNIVTFGFTAPGQPPTGEGPLGRMVAFGRPLILRVANSTFPVNATLSEDRTVLSVEYAFAPIGPGEKFIWGQQEPTVRTIYGGYVGPGIVQVPFTDIDQVPYAALLLDINTVHLPWTRLPVNPISFQPETWLIQELGSGFTTFAIESTGLTGVTTSTVTIGMHIAYTGTQFDSQVASVSIPTPAPVAVTLP